jgi:hypothetical protein
LGKEIGLDLGFMVHFGNYETATTSGFLDYYIRNSGVGGIWHSAS